MDKKMKDYLKMKIARKLARKRDGLKCHDCGKRANGQKLDTHHKNGNKKDLHSGIMLTLCRSCHIRRHAVERAARNRRNHTNDYV